jgi:hypothetical protein
MTLRHRRLLEAIWGAFALAVIFLSPECRADSVILHLRNGDRVAGTILSETTNQVTLSNVWAAKLVVPLSEIERRESLTNAPSLTNNTNLSAIITIVAATNAPPANSTAQTNHPPSGTNSPALAKSGSPAVLAPPPPLPKLPWYKHWKGDLLVGTTFIRGATDSELYYGKATFTYSQAYVGDPKEFFRNIFTFVGDYGKTAGVLSANDGSASSKTDLDVSPHIYLYNLAEVGYDKIRLINLHYEEGPGAGYHLFKQTNFTANAEIGANYQVDERSDDTTLRSVYYRLAEDLNWKITKQMTFSEKYEFFPRDDLHQYRMRFESTLAYALLANISFNLGVVDLYDTAPADSVPKNEFQFRTSLGIKF